ncbi:MAG TPA: TetR/AcrR family transcriptional regulator [Pseudomonadales bacterium]|nr:TetR/AcrR family transcriptional regulator [Pseudomonadales bacterium]
MSTREEAKDRRRRQITAAARTLMQKGDTSFTMRNLAETAGVSIATPYNLFGSKQAVMFAVMETDLSQYAATLAAQDVDELEVFFRAVEVAADHYGREPDYHRGVLFAAYSDGGREYRSLFAGPGHALWRDMVTRAVAAGRLRATVEANAFAATLEHLLFSCVLEWVRGELDLDELVLRAHYGFALVLLGMAEAPCRTALEARAEALQTRLVALWTAGTVAAGDARSA